MHTLNGKMEKDVFYVTTEGGHTSDLFSSHINKHYWTVNLTDPDGDYDSAYLLDEEDNIQWIRLTVEENINSADDIGEFETVVLNGNNLSVFFLHPEDKNIGWVLSIHKYSTEEVKYEDCPTFRQMKEITFKIQFFGENIKIGLHSTDLHEKIIDSRPENFIYHHICMEKIADDDPRLKLDLQ